jgi:hypothetical protein
LIETISFAFDCLKKFVLIISIKTFETADRNNRSK